MAAVLDLRARVATRASGGGHDYEIKDAAGRLLASGWARGSRRDALAVARDHARHLGLEVA